MKNYRAPVALFSALCFLILIQTFVQAQIEQKLEPGAPLAKKIRSDEGQTLVVNGERGEFVGIEFRQRGIDLSVSVNAPDGSHLITMASPIGWFGTKEIAFIVQESGAYALQITSARAGKLTGEYEARYLTRRAATREDRTRAEAWHIFAEADDIFRRRPQDVAALKIISAKFAAASRLFHSANDARGEATAQLELGRARVNMIELDAAIESFNAALVIWHALEDRAAVAVTLTESGLILSRLGKREAALAAFNEALAHEIALRDELDEGYTHYAMCRHYNDTGAMQEALDQCRRAINLQGEKDSAAVVMAQNMLGNIHSNLGDIDEGQRYYELALTSAEKFEGTIDPLYKALVVSNLAGIYDGRGDYRKALEYYAKALTLIYAMGQTEPAFELRETGRMYFKLGDYAKALEYLQQSLALSRKHGERSDEGLELSAIGDVYVAQKRLDDAVEIYKQARAINHATFDRYAEAETLYKIALVENGRRNFAAAYEEIEAALKISDALRANVFNKTLRTQYAAMTRNYHELNVEVLMQLARQNPSADYAARALEAHERARARTLLELVAESGADVRRDVDARLLEREAALRARLNALDEKRLTLAGVGAKAQEALSATEREIVSVTAEYEDVQEMIRRASPRYAALVEPRTLRASEIQAMLGNETALVEYALGNARSYAFVVTKDAIASFELPPRRTIEDAAKNYYALASQLAEQEAARNAASKLSKIILAPLADKLDERKRIIIVADGALQYVPFAALNFEKSQAPTQNLESGVESLESKDKQSAISHQQSTENRQSSNLQSAIRNPQSEVSRLQTKLLIEEHEIVYLPSFSTLAALRQAAHAHIHAARGVAVFADPVFGRDDARFNLRFVPRAQTNVNDALTTSLRDFGTSALRRLPFSRREAAAIKQAAGGDALLALDFDADRARVMRGELAPYRIVHFATHGLLNAKHPDLSGLVLSLVNRRGEAQNGFLRAQDIYTLNLPAELVVLSACQTGLGKEASGEGIIGLTRAFMYAGAQRVVSTLWRVDDEATAEMMRYFYAAMLQKGESPAAALRTAQIEMQRTRRFRAPFYWAGFTLQGEW